MEVLVEARGALQQVAPFNALIPQQIALSPPENYVGLKGNRSHLIQQTSLQLFRDALIAESPFESESRQAGTFAALGDIMVVDSDVSNLVDSQKVQLHVLAESVARVNGTVARLAHDLELGAGELGKVLASADPTLPTSLSVELPTGTVFVLSEEQARDIMATKVLEASAAIAEAFRMQHDVDVAQTMGDRLSREICELETALEQQRSPSAKPNVKTQAVQMLEAEQYYAGLANVLQKACGEQLQPLETTSGVQLRC